MVITTARLISPLLFLHEFIDRYVRQNHVPFNNNTAVEYNAAHVASGDLHNGDIPMSGILKDNVIGNVR